MTVPVLLFEVVIQVVLVIEMLVASLTVMMFRTLHPMLDESKM